MSGDGEYMKKDLVQQLHTQFEQMAQKWEDSGVEFWFARDLQIALGYSEWRNFKGVMDKAIDACTLSGHARLDHFVDINKMVSVGSGAEREIEDIALSRYACYLIAQNGDSSKEPIAFAQTYFALQTRKQELIEQRFAEIERIDARRKLSASEKELSGIIFEKLGDGQSFAVIRSKADKALFGGYSTAEMKGRMGTPVKRPLADFLPTITIKAKDFANEITNFNIKRDHLGSEGEISGEHVKNNEDVRKVLTNRGIYPENLPPGEDIKKVARRLKADEKKLSKPAKSIQSTTKPAKP